MFQPLRLPRAAQAVAQQIAQAILDGELRPGDRLPPERTLAWQMEISRPSVRDGVHLLAEAGILEVRPGGGGTIVVSDQITDALRPPVADLSIGEISGVLEARRLIEPPIAQLAAVYARDEDLDLLRSTNEAMIESAHDHEQFQALDQRFHLGIARATGNAAIVRIARVLQSELAAARKHMSTFGLHDPDFTIDIHERTLAAIMSRDPERIDLVMDEHLRYLERAWEQESGRVRLRRIPDFLLPREHRTATPQAPPAHNSQTPPHHQN
jgi:GntR family transcriptional repressor for pyruvate dehydrogenase complex